MKKAKGVPEGDRTIVLRQMKVRTALKGDFSWINNKNTDEEDEEEEGLARDVPVKASYSNGVSSAPSDSSSTSESSLTSQKPSPSGYIIRGVFTKTNDTTQASPTSASSYGCSESVRSSSTSTPQYSPLNKKSSEHYKKIAPHSVRSKAVSPAPEEPPSSTEERTKRTEAASSVIKSSASKERSYVLSAVNKYGRSEKLDSPSKDPSFSFVAKRVEINDEEPEEDSDTSPRIAPKSSLNSALKQKPTAAPRKLSPSTETKTQTTITIKETEKEPPKTPSLTETKTKSPSTETKTQTTDTKKETVFDTPKNTFLTESKSPSTETKTQTTITIKETAKEPPKTPSLTETKTKSPSTETKTQTTDTKKETVFDTPKDTFLTESKSPSTETKTQTTVTKETVFDIPKNPISTESKTKSSSTETITQTTMTKKETVSETPKPLTEPETKSSQDTKSLWDQWDLSAPTETITTTVTEKSSQDTKSLWDKWDKPAATETAITTVTEKSSHDTKSAWDKWDVPAATEITTTTITEKSSQDTKSLWDKWDKPAATETAITAVTEKSSHDTKSAWDKWDVPAATEITTTTITEKREADIVIPTWGVMDTNKNMSVSTQHQSPSTEIQTQTTVTKKETVFETEPVTKSAFKIAKETKQDPPTASDLISFGMEENSTVTTIHTTKYQTEDPVHKTFDSSGLTNITTDTTTHWSETPDPEHKKLVMVKEYVNSTGFNPSEYSSINKYDDITYSRSNYSYSSPSAMYRSPGTSCTYCGEMVGDDARITIEHLNIYSHPSCFKCGVCSKPMGELLESMYIHSGQVHCDSCYDKVF
ncbi:mucin-2-like isoform X10 [Acipenser ruthenus]|uniref:mucin-2-like isoform X10 n=1 Tax=Acipenser ruthenus TaxID=7906 RepID=UPI0027412B8F|nr:mucin-2-like isoform X10 [Acipenser ruthenus]